MITRREQNGIWIYTNTATHKIARVWAGDLDDIGEMISTWQPQKGSACRHVVDGDYSYRTLQDALDELQETREEAEEQEALGHKIDADDYLDLTTAIEDLVGILGRITRIAS